MPPLARLTVVAMLPDPLATPQLDPADVTQVHEALLIEAGSVSVTVLRNGKPATLTVSLH